jgi:hypothetical protein
MRSKFIIGLIPLLMVAVGLFYLVSGNAHVDENVKSATTQVLAATIHKSPDCSCCLGHAGYLTDGGFDVETIVESDMDSIKKKYTIPYDMQSCHTTEIEGYFVEGHVPIEAINKLLIEKPDIDGIALPDMPSGSPGMPGSKREDFVIYSLKDGIAKEYMRI